jgi:aminoglycoside phosphotransferase (APT) family kinase protein
VTAARAVGAHAPYAAVPAAVRAWVDAELGSPVASVAEQAGGMSPGCATRVVAADGRRAFVKAVGSPLNPDSPVLFRREVEALRLLGAHPLWASLRAAYDDGTWVALLLEDVDGTTPDLADDATMAALLSRTDALVEVLGSRVPVPPPTAAPSAAASGADERLPVYRDGPVDVAATFRTWRASWDRVPDLPADAVPAWLRAQHDDLTPLVDLPLGVPADHVCHDDIRNDNLIRRPSGELVFVDWGTFAVGPAWTDPLLARLERVDQPWFDDSVADSPALAAAGDDLVTGWLLGFGVHAAWRAHTAVDQNLPTLRAFRRAESARVLGAAGRRLGL